MGLPDLFRYGDWVRTTEPLTVGKTVLPAGTNGTVTSSAYGETYIVEFPIKDQTMSGGYRFETALVNGSRLTAVPASEDRRTYPRRGRRP